MAEVRLSSDDDGLDGCFDPGLDELWPTRLAAGIIKRDLEAVDVWSKRRKRGKVGKLAERARWLADRISLAKADRECAIYNQIDRMHVELRKLRATASGVSTIPLPQFMTGQSVLQWWAPWMVDATELPKTYKGKKRPAWFCAEVTSYKTYETLRYAGQVCTGNTYNVY